MTQQLGAHGPLHVGSPWGMAKLPHLRAECENGSWALPPPPILTPDCEGSWGFVISPAVITETEQK